MIERRLEQAAEEGGGTVMKGRQVSPDTRGRLSPLLSFPQGGNGWSKPLDSSFRWNDAGGWGSGTRQRKHRGYRNSDNPIPTPVVIPAKAGIHAYRTQVIERRLEQAAEEGETEG